MSYPLKIASIVDTFGYEWLKYECNLIPLYPHSWREILTREKPDLLLVQSAWHGNDQQWYHEITDIDTQKDNLLKDIVTWCKHHNIPTVFWNIEDPYHFKAFIDAAKLFDYIFTTDCNSISRYLEVVEHKNVYTLPFGAQLKKHNPIDKDKEKLGKIGFAGTWYDIGHEDRKRDMENVVKPTLKYGVHIYDRMYNFTKWDWCKFPDIYRPNIKGSIPYEEMESTYKKYDVFLNVNTVQDSPTMFACRVFELLACGINVISGYALGIDKMLPNIVKLCKTEEDTIKHLEILLNNKELRDRLSILGQREVFNKHTYRHRLETILEKVGLCYEKKEKRKVTIITCTHHPNNMKNVFANFERQNYKKKELIIILNNNSMDIQQWKEEADLHSNIKVFQIDEEKSLGECLNFSVDQANYDYIAKFDDDNYYAPEYLEDLMNAFEYTDADIVGKFAYYAYLEGSKTLAVRFPNKENQYTDFLCGSAFIAKKEVFNKVRFIHESVNEDTMFFKECNEKGILLYCTDRFNYICIRHASGDEHSWKIQDDEFLRKCEIVGYIDDYITHITI
ncbi:glycosyltransferase family protein [Crassaminicella profunda]|uniref:glycosyltransferase family protein n=1 Tax=Crassaminicella profunda TaxID=1286698 RepID=UPI001CA604FB|nr:glycosyltransferase [Crassaminicella profunda]QZY57026.1 glycosyltransferase [Crassaminicella profunda]